jgi:hypothetical protein
MRPGPRAWSQISGALPMIFRGFDAHSRAYAPQIESKYGETEETIGRTQAAD